MGRPRSWPWTSHTPAVTASSPQELPPAAYTPPRPKCARWKVRGRSPFVGVTDPVNPVPETAEQVRDRVLLAAEHIRPDRLGTCDDCGCAPFADDVSTSRDTAWAKVRDRIEGTALAAEQLAG